MYMYMHMYMYIMFVFVNVYAYHVCICICICTCICICKCICICICKCKCICICICKCICICICKCICICICVCMCICICICICKCICLCVSHTLCFQWALVSTLFCASFWKKLLSQLLSNSKPYVWTSFSGLVSPPPPPHNIPHHIPHLHFPFSLCLLPFAYSTALWLMPLPWLLLLVASQSCRKRSISWDVGESGQDWDKEPTLCLIPNNPYNPQYYHIIGILVFKIHLLRGMHIR